MTENREISFHVRDMSCNHCVKTITDAIESTIPGTHVAIDLDRHIVTVTGTSDKIRLARIIVEKGYTPEAI